ncbi:DUF4242 domain-containing protein [Mangrovimonas sp. CR14]|uniref:DUF4242 domain-containing protein n=1 Tax=Mangrovimonas sp. CR14 TaxID=2706120 RepID=UPI0014235988|nr:DUF4242 domain-containing protein [Mangrovimonas sp. CR14]NIK92158.1 DUF4242 domain-containing protein [Mangrovimonas sp. CR14]
MRKYIIERDFPGAGKLTSSELQEIAKTSCDTVDALDKPYHWLETFITENKMFCVHIAENEECIRKHSAMAGFPIKSIREVTINIDPTTASK